MICHLLGGPSAMIVWIAKVEPFGAEAIHWAMQGGASEREFEDACHHAFECVDEVATSLKGDPIKFLLSNRRQRGTIVTPLGTGGGLASPAHAHFLETKVRYCDSPSLKRPAPPRNILETSDPGRLLLAYGLSRDPLLYPELSLPSQIPVIEPQPAVHVVQAPGPEQC